MTQINDIIAASGHLHSALQSIEAAQKFLATDRDEERLALLKLHANVARSHSSVTVSLRVAARHVLDDVRAKQRAVRQVEEAQQDHSYSPPYPAAADRVDGFDRDDLGESPDY